MPHFGLIDDSLGPEEYALQRARLHIRGGKRRLRQGKVSAGIVTLYDAMVSALDWYVASPERRGKLPVKEGDNLKDNNTVYDLLKRSGALDGAFDYEAFNKLVEDALKQEMPAFDYRELLISFESVMTQLGIMPFNENELPPEDPSTF
jgi:hypothetical protein